MTDKPWATYRGWGYRIHPSGYGYLNIIIRDSTGRIRGDASHYGNALWLAKWKARHTIRQWQRGDRRAAKIGDGWP